MKYISLSLFIAAFILLAGCDSEPKKSKALTKTCQELMDLQSKFTQFDKLISTEGEEWRYREEKMNEIIDLLMKNMAEKKEGCYYMTHPMFPENTRLDFIRKLCDKIIAEKHGHALGWFMEFKRIFAFQDDYQKIFSSELGRVAQEAPDAYLFFYVSLLEVVEQARMLDSTQWPDAEGRKELISAFESMEGGAGIAVYLDLLGPK